MAVSGDLQEMELTTLISVNCNEGNQARLTLENGDEQARIYFDDGNIAHIVQGDREGEEVLHDLLTWEEGSFELVMNVPPPAHTVDAPWSHLVLSGIQRIDERNADVNGGDGRESDHDVEWATEGWGEESATEPEETLDLAFEETSQAEAETEPVEQETATAYDTAAVDEILQTMADDIPGFVAADVVGMDGLAIAGHAADADFDAEASSAQLAMVMKLVERTADQLQAGSVADNLVTTRDTYMLARFLGDGSYYLGVTVDREASSLGNVRLLTRTYADDLWEAIPKQ